MTRNFCLSNLKKKLILVLATICFLCAMAFCLTACDDDTEISVTDPDYSKTETTTDITNPSFTTGTVNIDLTKLPITSPTGWTTATENSSNTSSVNSGVVLTTEDGWSALMNNLYNDSDFVNYVKNIYNNFDDNDVIEAIRTEKGNSNYNPTDADKKDYIVRTYLLSNTNTKFANPSVHTGATDNAIFMLNNIATSTKFGLGTAQKITSSKSVTLEKGQTYKISVWVKTANIENRGSGIGATIRLKNTFNSSTQAFYQISNITDTDWTNYSIYVKSDSDYTCAITLILGLGYGSGDTSIVKNWVEGTAYFDDITFEKVDDSATSLLTADNMVYGSEDNIEANVVNNQCFYDMSFDTSVNSLFTQSIALPTSGEFTTSNTTLGGDAITSKTNNSNSTGSVSVDAGIAKISVNQASYTVKLTDGSFTLGSGEFAFVSFYYKNQLNKLGSSIVTVDAIDKYNTIESKRSAISTFSVISDTWTKCVYLFKNVWEGQTRSFDINFVVGPTNVRTVEYASDFATGDFYIKDIKFTTGSISDFDDETNALHDAYTFFTNNANSTISLYAGYESEFVENESTTSYNIATAYGNFGDIVNQVTAPANYEGIVAGHAFIDPSSTNYKINDRIGKGTTDGVAGVINSEYLSNYTEVIDGSNIGSKLNAGSDKIQALMINNITAGSYGFIGQIITVNSSAYASLSVKVKVCDNAIANLYLVDVEDYQKKVLTLDSFTVNNDVISSIEKGSEINGSSLKFAIRLTSANMDEDGWATVNFFIATGNTSKSFRLEAWNGARDNSETSQGYIFVQSVDITTSEAFSEPSTWAQAFATEGNPLYDATSSAFTETNSLLTYTRELTETEKSFNADYPDEAISYKANYVWGKTANMVYGVFNTIDPVENDPYADKEDDEDTSSCSSASSDPASFWLGFSSILLAVVLVLAIAALIIKNIRAKRIANANDAKSHFKVTSRIRKNKTVKENKEEIPETVDEDTPIEESSTENAEEQKENYVYGDVQTFGEEKKEDK